MRGGWLDITLVLCAGAIAVLAGIRVAWQSGTLDSLWQAQLPAEVRRALGDASLTPGWAGWHPTLDVDRIVLASSGTEHADEVTLTRLRIVVSPLELLRGGQVQCTSLRVGAMRAVLHRRMPGSERATGATRYTAVAAQIAASLSSAFSYLDVSTPGDEGPLDAGPLGRLRACDRVTLGNGHVTIHRAGGPPLLTLSKLRLGATADANESGSVHATAALTLAGGAPGRLDAVLSHAAGNPGAAWLRVRDLALPLAVPGLAAGEVPASLDSWLTLAESAAHPVRVDVVGSVNLDAPVAVRAAARIDASSQRVAVHAGAGRWQGVGWGGLEAGSDGTRVQLTATDVQTRGSGVLASTLERPLLAAAAQLEIPWTEAGPPAPATPLSERLDATRLRARSLQVNYGLDTPERVEATARGFELHLPALAAHWSPLRMTAPTLALTQTENTLSLAIAADGPATIVAPRSDTTASDAPVGVTLSGRLLARRANEGESPALTVDFSDVVLTDGDGRADVRGQLTRRSAATPAGAMQLDAQLDLSDMRVRSITSPLALLPVGADLSRWLVRAPRSGVVRTLSGSARGRLDRLLSTDGGLAASARIEALDLAYLEEWPAATNVTLDGRVENGVVDLESVSGTISNAPVDTARVIISELDSRNPLLDLRLGAHGTVEQARGFLTESPLASNAAQLQRLRAAGDVAVDLHLRHPLGADGKPKVTTTIALRNATARLSDTLPATTGIRGSLRVEGGRISGTGLTALLGEQPLELDFDSAQPGAATIEFSTKFDAATLLGLANVEPAAAPWLIGSTDVEGSLAVDSHGGTAELIATSSLVGWRSDAPAPLRKAAATAVATRLSAALADGKPARWRLAAENRLVATGRDTTLTAVQLGDPASVASAALVTGRITSAKHGALDAAQWLEWLQAADIAVEAGGATPASERGSALLDIETDALRVGAASLGAARLRVRRNASQTTATLAGPGVQGSISVPRSSGAGVVSAPIVFDFERLAIDLPAEPIGGGTAALSPRDIPAMRIAIEALTVDERPLGALQAAVTREPDGIRVRDAELRRGSVSAALQGAWQGTRDEHRSTVSAQLRTDDIAELGGLLGVDDKVGGDLRVRVEGSWPAPLYDLDLDRFTGTATVESNDGHLPEVRRGAFSRLFSLVLLPSLPQRLRLDFSDVTGSTLDYETLKGTFSIANGSATTDDLRLRSSAATIDIRGAIRLSDNAYDQRITVTPRLGATLPLAPLGLAQRLLGSDFLDEAFALEYDVSGPIDAPVIERRVREGARPSRQELLEDGQ